MPTYDTDLVVDKATAREYVAALSAETGAAMRDLLIKLKVIKSNPVALDCDQFSRSAFRAVFGDLTAVRHVERGPSSFGRSVICTCRFLSAGFSGMLRSFLPISRLSREVGAFKTLRF